MTESTHPFTWRSIVLPAYLPTFLFAFGEGAIIPVIPVLAQERGASLAVAGLIAAMLMVGRLAGDIPSGWLVAKIGERNAMLGAALLAVIGVLFGIAIPNTLALGVGIFLIGISTAIFGLARHAFLTSFVPRPTRGRALSTLAGLHRAGWFLGPFLSAVVIQISGSVEFVFWVLVVTCIAVAIVLLLLPDPEQTFGAAVRARTSDIDDDAVAAPAGVFSAIAKHHRLLVKVGSGVGVLSAIRASRTLIIPLWAVSIGVDPSTTSLVIGVAGAIAFGLFYTGGQILDRWGILWGALPGLFGLALGHIVLAFTHDRSDAIVWFIAVTLAIAVADGITGGVVMTIGAELAPRDHPAPFLSAYRFVSDSGSAGAPLVISVITSAASISFAAAAMGVVGLMGVGLLALFLPKYLPSGPRT